VQFVKLPSVVLVRSIAQKTTSSSLSLSFRILSIADAIRQLSIRRILFFFWASLREHGFFQHRQCHLTAHRFVNGVLMQLLCRRCAAWIVSHLPASAFAQSVIYYDQWRQYLPPTSAKRSHCTSFGLELYTCRPHGVVAGQWSVVRLIFDTDPLVTSQRTDQALHRLATGR